VLAEAREVVKSAKRRVRDAKAVLKAAREELKAAKKIRKTAEARREEQITKRSRRRPAATLKPVPAPVGKRVSRAKRMTTVALPAGAETGKDALPQVEDVP
jgi:hypothetical protein